MFMLLDVMSRFRDSKTYKGEERNLTRGLHLVGAAIMICPSSEEC